MGLWVNRFGLFASFGKARSIEGCVYLQLGIWWMLCLGQEDEGKICTFIHRSDDLLDCVHIDVWSLRRLHHLEAIGTLSLLLMISSRRCWVYPVIQRFEVLNLFVKWRNLIEKQVGRKIKVLQFDHVGSARIDSCDLARIMVLIFTS